MVPLDRLKELLEELALLDGFVRDRLGPVRLDWAGERP
jgi:hypothetical protein